MAKALCSGAPTVTNLEDLLGDDSFIDNVVA